MVEPFCISNSIQKNMKVSVKGSRSHPSSNQPCYPLVNVNKKLLKDPPFSMGKSTISMAIFNSYVTNYQRVI
jgi:hypothetical protein